MMPSAPSVNHLIGVPWKLLGYSPDEGFSCYGLVRYLYAEAGQALPEDISDAAGLMRYLAQHEGLPPADYILGAESLFERVEPPYEPYDILVFRNIGTEIRHLGVAMDARWFAHCCPMTNGVARSELSRWRKYLRYGVRHRP